MKIDILKIRLVLYVITIILSVCRSEAQFYKVSLVKDINPGAAGSNPTSLTYCNEKLYFAANNGTAGIELWKSDGTSAGTSLVTDINAGAFASNPNYLTAIDYTLFFSASNGTIDRGLWRHQTAGAGAGSYLVKDVYVGGTVASKLSGLTALNGTLLFAAYNNINVGNELWKSTGTSAGTVLVEDINKDANYGSHPTQFTKVGNKVFFAAQRYSNYDNNSIVSYDLNAVDYYFASVQNGRDIDVEGMTNVNGTLFISGSSYGVVRLGKELYKIDANDTIIKLVKDIYEGESGGIDNNSSPQNLTNLDGDLYFSATTASGKALWKSDGTLAGTVEVKALPAPADFGNFCAVNGTLYFTARTYANGLELWKSDGTTAGTVLVKDIIIGTGSAAPANLFNFNGALYFTADDGTHGRELWRSNGTEAGTYMVEDINDGSASSNPLGFAEVDNELFFSASNGVNGIELWKLKLCPDIAIATASSTNITQDVINPHFFNGVSCNNLVASIAPYGGATSITGNATARLWNQAVQPIDYVKRHYQITPATNAATATARVTLYFTDAEFNAFNTQSPAPTRLLPVSTATSVQIAERKGYLRIEKRGGSSSNSSGLPITYPGSVETINPDDADIVWNATNSFWEVTFNVTTGFSGFYVKTRTDILPSTYTFTGDGNWDVPANWQYGAMPPPALTKGSEIIINPASGSCNLNIQYTVPSGVKITVKTGKTFQINGNLTIHHIIP
ncbi:MAG: ELWxxDGT repeat protein [Bacteroidota bacterium]